MITFVPASPDDWEAWQQIDVRLEETVFRRKTAARECWAILDGSRWAGVLRHQFFWDEFPFLTLIFLLPEYRGRGIGRQAITFWEEQMKQQGYSFTLTSTMSNEEAQHFYRSLGYADCGCLIKNLPQFSEPAELFFIKDLGSEQ